MKTLPGSRRGQLLAPSARVLELKNARVLEAQSFCRQHQFAGYDDYISLSRQMPFRGYFDVTLYEGENFILYTNNDDPVCASLGWTGEYDPLSTRLWQALASSAQTIFDIGARHGFFGFLAARAAPNAEIHCFEPECERYARMQLNTALNGCANIRSVRLAASRDEGTLVPRAECAGRTPASDAGIAAENRVIADRPSIHGLDLDSYAESNQIDRVDLARISVEGGALAVVRGMQKTIARSCPDILIEIPHGRDQTDLSALLKAYGYHFYAISDTRREIEACVDLRAALSMRNSNWLASVRDSLQIAEITVKALGRPVNFG